MNNWKEEFLKRFRRKGHIDWSYVPNDQIIRFIETEVIEKIIEDIPLTEGIGCTDVEGEGGGCWCATDINKVQKQLRAKWLGNKN